MNNETFAAKYLNIIADIQLGKNLEVHLLTVEEDLIEVNEIIETERENNNSIAWALDFRTNLYQVSEDIKRVMKGYKSQIFPDT